MIKKILIANRGEIAIRIAKTCKKMNIKVVGVFSKQDEDAYHLNYADEIFFLGDDPLRGSYLNQKKLLEIAISSKSDAIHPGYGFLSENYKFAKLLEKEKKIFIGPPASSIKLMGDKITSKKIAKKAGVNCIPGVNEAIKDKNKALIISKTIGYPIMIKATAGGGGKGMRIAYNDKDLIAFLGSAQNEAKNAFGDDRVFIEKYIENPRHIEIQILGDQFGNFIWVGDRECSIQRRHQKIIEEAPSSFLDDKMRKEMGEQSVKLAKEVGYHSAGTVEYVVNSNREFYFLEMNTRLQVEHPVTEETTGIDLVREMINIANKKKLKYKQNNISIKGWSFESRICAESPIRNFLPSAGKIKSFKLPSNKVRLDLGYREGEEVSIYYDSLLAKIISVGKDRKEAINQMLEALQKIFIDGIDTNLDFLMDIYSNKNFISGDINTNFIKNNYGDGYKGNIKKKKNILLVCLLALAHKLNYLIGVNKKYKNISKIFFIEVENRKTKIEILSMKSNNFKISIDKNIFQLSFIKKADAPIYRITIDNKDYYGVIRQIEDMLKIYFRGCIVNAKVLKQSSYVNFKKITIKEKENKNKKLISPMPGRVVKVLVKEGQKVENGSVLIILDAMKMENTITASQRGIVKKNFS